MAVLPAYTDEHELLIEQATALPAELSDLVVESRQDGFRFLDRLVRDWESGLNRFDGRGEALFVARLGGRLVGICGVNRDPYLNDAGVARLRHLYVAREKRRTGIGGKLVTAALHHARRHFRRVRLRTDAASPFYSSLGFLESLEEDATHEAPV